MTKTAHDDVLSVLQSKEERRKFYNKIAGVYDLLAERSEQPIRDTAMEILAAAPGERILEIGFGTGHCLAAIAGAVGDEGRAYGIDISEQMVTRTRQLLEDRKLAHRAELVRDDGESLPFDDAIMDGVFMSFTLELFDVPEIPRVLAECKRVLKPGGRLVVAGLSKEDQPGLVVRAFEWTHAHFPNLMDCRPIRVGKSIREAGFAVDQIRHERMWVPVEIVKCYKPL